MSAALAFALRNWQAALGLAVAGILSVLLMIRTDQRDDARAQTQLVTSQFRQFTAEVRATSERLRADAAERARRIEAEQNRITQEVSRDYQARIVDVRRRADAIRVRLRAAPATGASGNSAALSGVPNAAGGPDAAAVDHGLSFEDAVVATEQAVRLDELQRWIRRQAELNRDPATGSPER